MVGKTIMKRFSFVCLAVLVLQLTSCVSNKIENYSLDDPVNKPASVSNEVAQEAVTPVENKNEAESEVTDFVLPVATPEVINTPVDMSYPVSSAGIPTGNKLSSRRPVPTMTMDELERKPISTHAARFPFIGTWKTVTRILNVMDTETKETETETTITFTEDGKFSTSAYIKKYDITTNSKGSWRVVDGMLETYDVVNTTKSALNIMRQNSANAKSKSRTLIRWYDENSFEMLTTDLDEHILNAQKAVPNITSVNKWYDERGNFITKTVMKLDIRGTTIDTVSYTIIGRSLYHKQ